MKVLRSSSRIAILLGAAALVALSCREPAAPVTPPPAPTALLGFPPPPTGLVQCSPLPYDSVTQTVGPEGGVIDFGVHSLSIPAGALDSAVTITAIAPSDTVRRVQFRPQGLVFQQAASLTMSYASCTLLGVSLPKQIVYTDDLLGILEYLLSADDFLAQTVTGRLHHFSDYAIAW